MCFPFVPFSFSTGWMDEKNKQKWVDGTSPPPVLIDEWKQNLDSLPQKNLIVTITTDRGLCGGKGT